MAKEQKFISVVAYVHNDQNHLENFLENVMGKCTKLFERCELILVNDHSTDGSNEIIHNYRINGIKENEYMLTNLDFDRLSSISIKEFNIGLLNNSIRILQ